MTAVLPLLQFWLQGSFKAMLGGTGRTGLRGILFLDPPCVRLLALPGLEPRRNKLWSRRPGDVADFALIPIPGSLVGRGHWKVVISFPGRSTYKAPYMLPVSGTSGIIWLRLVSLLRSNEIAAKGKNKSL